MNKLSYRPNVSMIVFRSDGKVLVNHEKGEREERWKFPQGGVEKGETLEQTVKRELKEEVNVTHYSILAQAKYVHEYEWPEDTQKRKGFRGQKQHTFLIFAEKPEEAKPNEKVIIETKWLPFHEAVEKFNFENQQEAAKKIWKEFGPLIKKFTQT